jgi:hypothetical protein
MELCLEGRLLGLLVQPTEQVGELDHRVGGDARLAAGRRSAVLDVLRELDR